MAQDVFCAEVTVWDDAAGGGSGAAVTKYYATKGWASLSTDTPSETHFDERLKQPASIKRTMFAPNATRGRSLMASGDIILVNGDGELDDFDSYGVDGRAVVVLRGQIGAAYPSGWTEIFRGTMQGVEVTQEYVSLKIRDELARLTVPLQTTKYTGGGLGTLEGTEDTLKGKPKPICYGVAKNVAPPCVETAKLIFQVADAEVDSVDAVYDRGVELTTMRPYAFLAALGNDFLESSDGATWADGTQNISGVSNFRDLGYGKGALVAVGGTSEEIHRSRDGQSWTSVHTSTDPYEMHGVDTDGNGIWVTAGDGGRVYRSTDNGETWSRVGGIPITTEDVRGVRFLNNLWLIGCSAGVVLYSGDGLIWQRSVISGGASLIIYDFAWGADTYVAVGYNSGSNNVYTSPNGINWTQRTSAATATMRAVIFAESKFVAVGGETSGSIPPGLAAGMTSSDGITWSSITNALNTSGAGIEGALFDIAHDGATFLVVGGALSSGLNGVATSGDAATWTERDTGAHSGTILCVIWAPIGAAEEYASDTDLLDNALAPPAGHFKAYRDATDGSFFRLGASPDGLVTADVTQGAAASNRTTAQIWAAILDERAGMSSGDWSASDVTALDTANNAVIGFWTDQEVRVADVIDAVKDSAGAASYPDAAGVLRIKQFVAPSGAAVLSITANDLLRPLRRILPPEQGQGIPQYRTILRYQRNYTPQITDVASSVADARKGFLAKEWREIADTDTGVQTKHLLAIESVEETLLDLASDAATEADRRQTLRGTQRRLFEAALPLDDDTEGLDLNDVIEITHERYGLSGGELFRVIGHRLDAAKREITLDIWR